MSEAIEKRGGGQLEYAMSVENVMAQIQAIQELMSKAMKPGEHYGIIPGTSRMKDGKETAKPTLLKPGAEKLSMMFRLAPSYDGVNHAVEHPGGHLEYRLTCTMTNIRTGEVWGQGVGSCSTMETKYRFRKQETDTGEPIPADYKENKGHYRAMGFRAAKDEAGAWYWAKVERVEHDNPADYYNTVLKIAKKRSHVDAVLTCTAASDFFTQDLDDMADNGVIGGDEKQSARANIKPAQSTDDKKQTGKSGDKTLFDQKTKTRPEDKLPFGNNADDVFTTLEKELADFCGGDADAIQTKLMALTSFPQVDKETKKPTGKMVEGKRHVADLRMKDKKAWAWSALSKLRDEVNGER
ncbi:MAG: hypothetical protein KKC03_14000 [Bacteroidetes bacterium]|nr:hypothetical protein [Bacteroidota bacterium]